MATEGTRRTRRCDANVVHERRASAYQADARVREEVLGELGDAGGEGRLLLPVALDRETAHRSGGTG